MASQPGQGFIGSEREMAVLNAALLDEALAGHGKVIMLAGEPGIGKTRLVKELARKAEERGVRVLWLRGRRRPSLLALGQFYQELRSRHQAKPSSDPIGFRRGPHRRDDSRDPRDIGRCRANAEHGTGSGEVSAVRCGHRILEEGLRALAYSIGP